MTLNRRDFLCQSAAWASLLALPSSRLAWGKTAAEPHPFAFEYLVQQARKAAQQAYTPPPRPMPEITQQINYAKWGEIKFNTDKAPFQQDGAYPITFFHLGTYFQNAVRMYQVRNGQAQEIIYDPSLFKIPENNPARQLPPDSGFAGFRFQEYGGADDWRTQDWLVFLGGCYLRTIGASGQYGLSARGVAVNPAVADQAEEFPNFTAFYIEETTDPEKPVVVCAQLDGPSITGAFRFTAHRGLDRSQGVDIEVEAEIFLRRDIERLGLMPLTSMFWYSEYGRERPYDWRPEVHDSDGLAIWMANGERLWRPLNNPRTTRVSAFSADSPQGFGLMQRDRNFDHYRDGVFYDRRPSLWIEPIKPLGQGTIQLLEIPTNDEIHDNIGAFWVPEAPAQAGQYHSLHYRMYWQDETPHPATHIAQAISTRFGRGGQPGQPRPDNVYKVAVEFDRPEVLQQIPYGVMPDVIASTTAGKIVRTRVEPVPNGNVWRAIFDVALEADQIAELRLYLALEGKPLTETWAYQFDRNSLFPAT